jgi:hypothetical protein
MNSMGTTPLEKKRTHDRLVYLSGQMSADIDSVMNKLRCLKEWSRVLSPQLVGLVDGGVEAIVYQSTSEAFHNDISIASTKILSTLEELGVVAWCYGENMHEDSDVPNVLAGMRGMKRERADSNSASIGEVADHVPDTDTDDANASLGTEKTRDEEKRAKTEEKWAKTEEKWADRLGDEVEADAIVPAATEVQA